MSDFDDLHGVTQPPIPDDAVEQLLRGTWTGADGGEDLAHVAELFRAARSSADATELASLEATVAAFRDEVVGAQVIELTTARKRPMFKKYLTAKTAAVVGVLTFATAGAAAATGTFPTFSGARPRIESPKDDSTADTDVEDSVVDDTVVDTEVDDTEVDTTEVATTTAATVAAPDDTTAPADAADSEAPESEDDAGTGPDATGPAKHGLCTAYFARSKHDATEDSTAPESTVAGDTASTVLPIPFQNLEDAATAAGQTVEQFCADATPGGKAADGNGASGKAHGHSGDDNPSATAPGHADDDSSDSEPADDENPSVTAPGHGANSSSSKSHGSDDASDTAALHSGSHGSNHE